MTRYARGTVMVRGATYALKPSGPETASTTGSSIEVGDGGAAYVEVTVSDVIGTTPTMVLVFEGSNDRTNWFTLATLGANGASVGGAGAAPNNITAAGVIRALFSTTQFLRCRSVIGGTAPQFTYSVNVDADEPVQ